MNVGAELAQARQKLGLSLADVSSRTKINVERLSAIEEMDAARLPSLIYLKGFLRSYAAEVQHDPEILTERYLSQLNVIGGLDIIAKPPAGRPPVSVGESNTSPVRPAALPPEILEFASESTARVPEPPASQPRVLEPDDVPELDVLRPHDDDITRMPPAPSRAWRRSAAMLLVLPLAGLVGWLLGENYDALARNYGGTIGQSYGTIMERVAQVREFVPFAQDKPAKSSRRQASGAEASDAPRESARREAALPRSTADPERPDQPGSNHATAASDRTRTPARAHDPAAEEIAEPPAKTADDNRAQQANPADADQTPDAARAVAQEPVNTGEGLSGWWSLTSRVESSSYAPYNGMNVGFHLQFRQVGDHVSGTGQKWMENGRSLTPDQRTPITVEGTIDGNRLHLGFTERGASRTSAGTFTLSLTDADTLSGTFESDAADSQGTSLARRVQPPRR